MLSILKNTWPRLLVLLLIIQCISIVFLKELSNAMSTPFVTVMRFTSEGIGAYRRGGRSFGRLYLLYSSLFTLSSEAQVSQLRSITRRLALRLGVVGLINIQFAIKDMVVYVIEANPRASRTVPLSRKLLVFHWLSWLLALWQGRKRHPLVCLTMSADRPITALREAVMPFRSFPRN